MKEYTTICRSCRTKLDGTTINQIIMLRNVHRSEHPNHQISLYRNTIDIKGKIQPILVDINDQAIQPS